MCNLQDHGEMAVADGEDDQAIRYEPITKWIATSYFIIYILIP
jgi:hypothetical protein